MQHSWSHSAILSFRTWAVWNRNRRVGLALVAVQLTHAIVSTVCAVRFVDSVEGTHFCFLCTNSFTSPLQFRRALTLASGVAYHKLKLIPIRWPCHGYRLSRCLLLKLVCFLPLKSDQTVEKEQLCLSWWLPVHFLHVNLFLLRRFSRLSTFEDKSGYISELSNIVHRDGKNISLIGQKDCSSFTALQFYVYLMCMWRFWVLCQNS